MDAIRGAILDAGFGATLGVQDPEAPAQRGRALIADDEANVRLVLREMLIRLGYEPVCAEDGAAAMQILDQPDSHFTLLICDLTMPSYSGLEVIEHAGAVSPGMPAIITTGYDDWNKLSEFSHNNVVGILPKPFGMPELRCMLEERVGDQVLQG